jgi:hypothetical protein
MRRKPDVAARQRNVWTLAQVRHCTKESLGYCAVRLEIENQEIDHTYAPTAVSVTAPLNSTLRPNGNSKK